MLKFQKHKACYLFYLIDYICPRQTCLFNILRSVEKFVIQKNLQKGCTESIRKGKIRTFFCLWKIFEKRKSLKTVSKYTYFLANSAATVGGLFWIVSYLPYFLTQHGYDEGSLLSKLLSSFLSNSAMGLGFHIILLYEVAGEGKCQRSN